MNTGQLKEMLADIGDDFPVLVKTANGWKHVTIAYEEILYTEKTPPGVETEAFFLELCPTVEELEPYSVEETTDYFSVDNEEDELCIYWKAAHPNAKAAAEAECARLNAEHRKEQA